MAVITKGTMFPTTLVSEMFNTVKGHSSIAKMVGSDPIPFNGVTEFTFAPSNKVSVVGETGNKPAGDGVVTPVTIRPIKVVYQMRVSDEFIYGSEEAKLGYLRTYSNAFARMLATGLDEMIMHGANPASGSASSVIGNNNLDYVIANYASGANVITSTGVADADIDSALNKVEEPNGIILGKTLRGAIASETTTSGAVKYPEFAWGATPSTLGGMKLDSNKTVEADSSDALAYVGDWNALKWGFAKEMPLKVIEYGNPDGQGDLQATNEVVIRSEAYVGWGILDASAFAKVEAGTEANG